MRTILRGLARACFVSMLAAGSAGAADTTVRVTFRSGPVRDAPVEIIDVRSGVVVASAETDAAGRAHFSELPTERLFEAQTPNGEFVSGAFEAGSSIELRIAETQGPLVGLGLIAGAEFGGVFGRAVATDDTPTVDPTEDSGTGAFIALPIRGRVTGPELGSPRLRPFVEAAVTPFRSFSKEPETGIADDTATPPTQTRVRWNRELAWQLGAGIGLPLPSERARAWVELMLGYHEESLDIETPAKTFDPAPPPARISDEQIRSVFVSVATPIEVWRRGGFSTLIDLAVEGRFPLTGDIEVERLEMSPHTGTFTPDPTVLVRIGVRGHFDYVRRPSLGRAGGEGRGGRR